MYLGLRLTAAYANLAYLNSLIGLGPSEYQMLAIFLADLRDIDTLAREIYQALEEAGTPVERPLSQSQSYQELEAEALGQLFGQAVAAIAKEPWEGTKFSVITLNEMMEPVVAAMGVLDSIALGIFLILLLITAVGILNTFRMVIIERTREIGTMRAFGMQKRTVRSIFLWEAAFISLGGGVAGLVLAGVIASGGSRILFNSPGLEFFLDAGHVTFAITAGDLIGNLLVVLAISLWRPSCPPTPLPGSSRPRPSGRISGSRACGKL